MKILFAIKAINSTKGGAERVLADVTAELARRGHEISLLTFDQMSDDTFYPLSPSIKRIALGKDDAMAPAGFGETLRRIPMIRQVIKSERPDAVVAFMHSMFIPAAFANAGLRVPFLASEHIVRDHYKGRKLEFLLFLASSVFTDAYTVLSEKVKKTYPVFLRRKMHPIPNPVRQAIRHADPVKADGVKRILAVGRFDLQKRQDILIAAFARLSSRYPDWEVVICGEGPLEQTLSKKITETGMEKQIRLLPPTRTIDDLYCSAQIFAIPSSYESFGLVTAEAMSHGLPVVGFADCPGTNELVNHNISGILADGGENEETRVTSLADSLACLMDDAAKRQTMGHEGTAIAATYDIKTVSDRWEALLKTISIDQK